MARTDTARVHFGIALPSFVRDPDVPLAVARAAEQAGLDAVFCYDHLFRSHDPGERRPALEVTTLLGALAASTRSISIGTLVARATLRPPAQLAVAFDTANRISGGRLIAAVGAGDGESRDEMLTFGYDFGTVETRVAALEAAVAECRDRGYPVWVGGRIAAVREVAARLGDGWNAWGTDATTFGVELAEIRAAEAREVTATWGGLVLVGVDDDEVAAKRARFDPGDHVLVGTPDRVAQQLRAHVSAGAEWIIAAPLDSSNPANPALLAAVADRF